MIFVRRLLSRGRKWPNGYMVRFESAGRVYKKWRTFFGIRICIEKNHSVSLEDVQAAYPVYKSEVVPWSQGYSTKGARVM